MRGSDDGGGVRALSLGVAVVLGVAVLGGGFAMADLDPWRQTDPQPTPTQPDDAGATDPTATADPAATDGQTTADSTATAGPESGGEPEADGAATGADPGATTGSTPAPLPAGDRLAGTRSLADSDVVIAGDGADELGYGVAVGDLNGDGTSDVVLGAPLHNATATRSGAAFVFFGPVAPGNLTVDDADARFAGESRGDWAGNSVTVGDVDGDGVDDLVAGAPRSDAGADNAGAVYVVRGGQGLDGSQSFAAADARMNGTIPGSMAGYSVATADLVGDGRADVLAGAPRGDDAPGRAYLVDGGRAGTTASLGDADATFVGGASGAEAGWSVAARADVTADSEGAVIVGAPRSDVAGEDSGAAYVVAGPFDGRTSLAGEATVLSGAEAGDRAGWSVAAPGDVDGDGGPEYLVGAPRAGAGGAAYVASGGGDRSLADATALRGASAGDSAGWSVAGTRDLTCDGRADLLVGAPDHDAGGEDAGAVHVVGETDGTNLANATATLAGSAAGDQVGRAEDLGTIPGGETTGLVVGAPFGDAPHTAHVEYVTCASE